MKNKVEIMKPVEKRIVPTRNDPIDVVKKVVPTRNEIRAEVVDLLLRNEKTSPKAVVEKIAELMTARKGMLAGTELMDVVDNGTRSAAVGAVLKAYGIGSEVDIDIDARKIVMNVSVGDRAELGRIVGELRRMNEELMGGSGQSGEVIKKERGEG